MRHCPASGSPRDGTRGSWTAVGATGARSRDLHSPHHPPKRSRVVDREMLDAAVVPERDGPHRPPEAAGEFRTMAMLHEEAQQRPALVVGQPLDADRIGDVDE